MTMIALRCCHERDASRFERQLVRSYKRKGQCDLNLMNRFDAGPTTRKFGVKPPVPRWKKVRKRVMTALLRIDRALSMDRRAKLAEWIVDEIIDPMK